MSKSDEILKFIVAYRNEHQGRTPTLREIASGVGLAQPSTVKYHIDRDARMEIMGHRYIMVTEEVTE